MSEIGAIFQSLPSRFVKNGVKQPRTFYFALDDDELWTVRLSPGSKALVLDVWKGRYVPTALDFMTGKIRSNNPLLLKEFMAAFGKRV
jgi:hypothetical protein